MIDTHAHIDDEQYSENIAEYIKEQQACGVEKILIPCVDLLSLRRLSSLCDEYSDYLLPAIGLHPEEVREDYMSVLNEMEPLLDSRKWVGIGEIGLDYHFDKTYVLEQQLAFRRQLDWALLRDLPVMVHNRDATEDCLSILEEYTSRGLRGVMHCFSGSHETAERVVDMGMYLGIGGVITFKNCKLSEHLRGIGIEHILTETDSPYMSPVPHRGKRNESRWMSYVISELSKVYGISEDEVDRITTTNAKRLFRL